MNKLPIWLLALATVLLALGCAEQTPSGLAGLQPSALVVPGASSLQMQVSSNAEFAFVTPGQPSPPSGTVIDTDSKAQNGTLNPLSVSASALAAIIKPDGNPASVLTTGDATATWVDAAEGQVVFTNIGWDTDNVSQGFTGVGGAFSVSVWTYTFTADRTGLFTVDFVVTLDGGSGFGLTGFRFSGLGGPLQFALLGTSGTITRNIIAGNTFTVEIGPMGGITGGLGTRDGKMTGTFDWRIDTFREIAVDIDIKPGSDPNCIKAESKGFIPVAILSSASFDAADVDVSTVELDGVPSVRSSLNKDVNGDGLKDLVLHFSTVALKTAGSLIDGDTLFITGALFDGTPIQGSDLIFLARGPNCFD